MNHKLFLSEEIQHKSEPESKAHRGLSRGHRNRQLLASRGKAVPDFTGNFAARAHYYKI